ncbi:MAG TPA: hypothetical protein VKI43_15385 [Vicinamibacterales bacterium]|nr:hypothetical protein [Vicinamibacterales bacterium]
MPMPAPAEASLINGDEFLDELEHSEHLNEYQPDPALDSPTYADAFDALESGLSIDALALPPQLPYHERAPILDEYEPPDEDAAPVASERSIPFVAAALVIVVCLTAGATTAAFVFHDRVARITAPRSANR